MAPKKQNIGNAEQPCLHTAGPSTFPALRATHTQELGEESALRVGNHAPQVS